jgi:hypothetical protein
MALKDWYKHQSINKWSNRKTNENVFVFKGFNNSWNVKNDNGIIKNFRNKSTVINHAKIRALKFAKSYMRTH